MEGLIEFVTAREKTLRAKGSEYSLTAGRRARSEHLPKNVTTFECGIRLPNPACPTSRLSQNQSCSRAKNFTPPKLFTIDCGVGNGVTPRRSWITLGWL